MKITGSRAAGRCALLLLGVLVTLPHAGLAQLTGTQRGWTYTADVRQAEGRTDRLGIDFDIAFSSQQEPKTPVLDSYGLTVRAKGFETFERDTREVNSLIGELALQGWRYRSAALRVGSLAPEQILELERLLEKQGSGGDLKQDEARKLDDFVDLARTARQFFTYGAHYRLETTQDVKVTQNVFGVSGATEIPLLGKLLDVIPAATRSVQRPAFPLRALLAVDYVRPQERAAEGESLLDSATWRTRAELAWSAVMLDRFILRATWEAHYFVNAHKSVRDTGLDFNNFLQAWIKVPITPEAGVMVKYLSGRLPPTYEDANIAALGLSISFYP